MLARSARLAPLLASLLAFSSCSADSVTPPEPVVERPGSFVAVTEGDGSLVLLRTLRVVPIDSRESLFEAIHYQGSPESHEEAEKWAKDPAWPIADRHAVFSLNAILSVRAEVVWFRTLTESELEALR
ncbi:MAG TPA: hypothetical protein VFZ53_32530 [Polyangiaceae bacterium]